MLDQASEIPGRAAGSDPPPIHINKWPSASSAYYALFMLTLGTTLATIDRTIISLLVEPIKADLGINDTQFSLLVGFAFVSLYAVLGIPIARWADVRSRRMIIGVGIAFWSTATALCGVAQSYWQLFVARMGVGAGEASFTPAAYSILSDSFRPEKLPMAIAVLTLGFTFGTGIANFLGGAVVQLLSDLPSFELPIIGFVRNWQLVFIVVALPGLLLALLMRTVEEPQRKGYRNPTLRDTGKAVSYRELFAYLAEERRAFGPMFLALALKMMLSYGVAIWLPAFFIRTYGWTASETAYGMGVMVFVSTPLGLWLGVQLTSYFTRRGYDDANMRAVLIASFFVLPTSVLMPLMPDGVSAMIMMCGIAMFSTIGIVPGSAALQIIVPNEMRSQVRALYMFVSNVFGYGLGPVFVALFTDFVFMDGDGIRYSILAVGSIFAPLLIVVTWYGLKPYGEAVRRSRTWS